ncbi:MAG: hypothetical protein R2844_22620 [Caldilineales bacterium]
MRYQHRFRVQAPVEVVAAFHSRSAAMGIITPPPLVTQVHRAPELVAVGESMEFTLWMGPLPMRWVAGFEDVTPTGFVDRMVRGPVRRWQHRHSFVAIDKRTTDVVDEVEIELRAHPFWGPVGLAMALNLPLLFAYRGWQTRRLLNSLRSPAELHFDRWQADARRFSAIATAGAVAAVGIGALAGLFRLRRR